MFFITSIMLTKLSILTFFTRFVLWGWIRLIIYATMAIVVMYSVVTAFQYM